MVGWVVLLEEVYTRHLVTTTGHTFVEEEH